MNRFLKNLYANKFSCILIKIYATECLIIIFFNQIIGSRHPLWVYFDYVYFTTMLVCIVFSIAMFIISILRKNKLCKDSFFLIFSIMGIWFFMTLANWIISFLVTVIKTK